jgi:hypothetical protein
LGRESELTREARLADAGLARHEDEPALAGARFMPGFAQDVELAPAPHEGRALARRQRRRERHPALADARRRGRGPANRLPGQQARVQRLNLRSRRGTELVAQQHPQVVVHQQPLGDVAARRERLHEEAVAGLAIGRARNELPARPLRDAEVGRPDRERSPRDQLERLQQELLYLAAADLHPVAINAREEARAEQPGGRLRVLAHAFPEPTPRRGASRLQAPGRLADVHPHRFGEHESHPVAALDRGGFHAPAKPRQDRPQGALGIARRAFGPQHGDQLVAIRGPVGARQQVAEQRRGLAPRQPARDIHAIDLEAEGPAEPAPGSRLRLRRVGCGHRALRVYAAPAPTPGQRRCNGATAGCSATPDERSDR